MSRCLFSSRKRTSRVSSLLLLRLVSCSYSFFFLPPLFSRLPFSREMFNKNSSRASTGRKCRRWGTSCARRVESLSRNRSGIPWDVRKRGLDGGGRGTTRRRDAFLNSPHSGHEGRRTISRGWRRLFRSREGWNELVEHARWKINTTFAGANIVYQVIISAAGKWRGLRGLSLFVAMRLSWEIEGF